MRLSAAALVLAALSGPSAAKDTPPALFATYVCDGAAVLQVAYLNPEAGPSLAVVGWAGKLLPMQAGPTGSGVRYVAIDADDGYVWHSKGDAGTLLRTADEQIVLGGCARAGS